MKRSRRAMLLWPTSQSSETMALYRAAPKWETGIATIGIREIPEEMSSKLDSQDVIERLVIA